MDGAALCVREGVLGGVRLPLPDGEGDAASEGVSELDAVSVGVEGRDALPLGVADSLPLAEELTAEAEGEPLCRMRAVEGGKRGERSGVTRVLVGGSISGKGWVQAWEGLAQGCNLGADGIKNYQRSACPRTCVAEPDSDGSVDCDPLAVADATTEPLAAAEAASEALVVSVATEEPLEEIDAAALPEGEGDAAGLCR
jgi:hypothetical protein